MSYRFLASLGALAVVAWLVPVPVAGGQAAAAAGKKTKDAAATWRTPWGDPDLQGAWSNHDQVPLERPSQHAGKKTLTDEEVAVLQAANKDRDRPPAKGQVGAYNDVFRERLTRSNRTAMIIDPEDGKLPPMTPEAQKKIDPGRRVARAPASYEDRDVSERCITRGMPGSMIAAFYNHNYQILQVPGYVVIHMEMIHDARIIPLDGRPRLSQGIGQWMGDPRGRWEGDTLVVETTNFNDRTNTRDNFAFGTAEGGRLTERFTRVDANTIDYQFTVDDPKTYTKPWTAYSPLQKISVQLYEFACHEGNYAMEAMLSGARAEEANKATQK